MPITLKRRSLTGFPQDQESEAPIRIERRSLGTAAPNAPASPPIRIPRRGITSPSAPVPGVKLTPPNLRSPADIGRQIGLRAPAAKFTGQPVAPKTSVVEYLERMPFVRSALTEPLWTMYAPVPEGFASLIKPLAEQYDYYADKVSKATGLGDPDKKRALQALESQYRQDAKRAWERGIVPRDFASKLAHALYSGLGSAFIQIPKYVGASAALAPARLGSLGMAAVEFIEATPEGIEEATVRGAQGAAFQQYVKAISLLPRSIQLPTAFGTFAGATALSGGSSEETVASGMIGMGLSLLSRAPSMKEFRSRYAKDPSLIERQARRIVQANTLNDYRAWRKDATRVLDKYKDTKALDSDIRTGLKKAGQKFTETDVVRIRNEIRNLWSKQVSDSNRTKIGGLRLPEPRDLLGLGQKIVKELGARRDPLGIVRQAQKQAPGFMAGAQHPFVARESYRSPRRVMLRWAGRLGPRGIAKAEVKQPEALENWFWERMSEAERAQVVKAQKAPLHPAPKAEVAPEFRFTGKEIQKIQGEGRPVPQPFAPGEEPVARQEFPQPKPAEPPAAPKFTGQPVQKPPLTQTGQPAPFMSPAEIYRPQPSTRFQPKEPPQPKVPKKPSVITEIRQLGGIDPDKAALAGYPFQSFKEFGLVSALKKGGPGLDDVAKSLVEAGKLEVKEGENPSDALMRVLQYEREDYLKAAERLEGDYEREYQEWLKQNPGGEADAAQLEAEIRRELDADDRWEEEIDVGPGGVAPDLAQEGPGREGEGDLGQQQEPPAQPPASAFEQGQPGAGELKKPQYGTLREVGVPRDGVWITEMDMSTVPRMIKKHGDFDVLIRYAKRPDERIKASELVKKYYDKTLRPKGDDTIVGVFVIRSVELPPEISEPKDEEEAAYGSKEKKNQNIRQIADDLRSVRSTRAVRLRAVSQYAKEFKKRGFIDYRGTTVKTAQDIAEIAATFRHPKAEHFQAIYLKSGKVVAHRVLTSGAPDYVAITQRMVTNIESAAKRLGADAVYVAHNHPSSNPKPSRQDLQFTVALRQKLGDKFKGHVIIDDTEFTVSEVSAWKSFENVFDVDTRFVKFAAPKIKLAPVGEQVITVERMAGLVKDYVKKGSMTIVFSDGGGRILSVDNVGAQKQIPEYIRQKMRAYGAVSYAIAFRQGDVIPPNETQFPRGLVDVIRIGEDGEYVSVEEGTLSRPDPGAYQLNPSTGPAQHPRVARRVLGIQEEAPRFTGKARPPEIPEFENSKQAFEFGARHFKDQAVARALRAEYEKRKAAAKDDLRAKHVAGLYREAAEVAEGEVRGLENIASYERFHGKGSIDIGKIPRIDLPDVIREEAPKFTGKAKTPKPTGEYTYIKPKGVDKEAEKEPAFVEYNVLDSSAPEGVKRVKKPLREVMNQGGFFNVPMDPAGNFPMVDPDFLRQKKVKTTILQYWTPTEYHLKQLGFDQHIGQPIREALQDFSIELTKKGNFLKDAQKEFYDEVDARNKVLKSKGKKEIPRKEADEIVWQMMDKGIPDDVQTPEAKTARKYRKETEEMLTRMNDIRAQIGQPEIEGIKNYILHMLRPEFLNEIYGRGVIPTELAKIMEKIPPKKLFLRTAEHRHGVPEEWLVKNPHQLMRAMYAIDLRYIHLQKALADVQPYLDAVKEYRGGTEARPDEWSPATYKYLDDWVKQAIKMRPSNMDELIENLMEYTIAPVLRMAGVKVSHMPWRDFVNLLAASSHTGALGMRIKPVLRNLVQSTFDWVMYGTGNYMKGYSRFMTPEGHRILKESKIWRTRMPFEAQDLATLNKIFRVGSVAYRGADLHNVGVGLLTRYYYARQTLKYDHKKALRWADDDLPGTQWSYRREDLPRAYWTTTGRFVWNLGSWWMNFYTRFLREIVRRTFEGKDVNGREVPPVERMAGLRLLVLIGLLFAVRAASKELTGTVVDYTGQIKPTPGRTSPMFQLANSIMLVAQGIADENDMMLKQGLKQLGNTAKIFVPWWLAGEDIFNLITGKKEPSQVLFYGRQPGTGTRGRRSKTKSGRNSFKFRGRSTRRLKALRRRF